MFQFNYTYKNYTYKNEKFIQDIYNIFTVYCTLKYIEILTF